MQQRVNFTVKTSGTNVVFHVGEKIFFAHKVILAARSDLFNNMFSSGMKEATDNIANITVSTPVLTTLNPSIFLVLLHYIYTDDTDKILTWPVDKVLELYVFANLYQISRLEYICAKVLMGMINPSNIKSITEMLTNCGIEMHGKSEILQYCVYYLKDNKTQLSRQQIQELPAIISREVNKKDKFSFQTSVMEQKLAKATPGMFIAIFQYLELVQIKRLRQVCSWLMYVVDNDQIWKGLALKQKWATALLPTSDDSIISWADYYVYKHVLSESWLSNKNFHTGNLQGHTGAVMCVSLPNDAVLDNMDEWLAVSGSVDKTIRVWNVQTGKAVRTLTGHTATVTGVQLNTSAQWVASCSEDCSVRLWDVASGECRRQIGQLKASAKCVSIVADKILSGGDNCNISVWDMETGELANTLTGHTRSIWCLQTTGELTLTGSDDKTVRVWDARVSTNQNTLTLTGHTSVVSCLQTDFSSFVVSGSGDGTVRVWDLRYVAPAFSASKCLRILESCHKSKAVMGVYKDGHALTTAGYDNTVCIWNTLKGTQNRLSMHGGAVRALAANDRLLLCASYDKTISVCDFAEGSGLHISKDKACIVS